MTDISHSLSSRPWLRILSISLGLLGGGLQCASADVTLEFHAPDSGDRFGYVQVVGLPASVVASLQSAELSPAEWAAILAVRVAADESQIPHAPMLGRFLVVDGGLRFVPRFGWQPGLRYRATFSGNALSTETNSPVLRRVDLEFVIPRTFVASPPTVTHVFPSSAVLPENQLKFYLHFSTPMRSGNSYSHIELLDELGDAIPDPFLELGEELWDRSGQRLTLLIDPGRIKRGLKPREDVGPVFEQGKNYTLVIKSSWLDTGGLPLKRSYRKAFHVSSPDVVQPDMESWQIGLPTAGTHDALVVRFSEPLDQAMLEHVVAVQRDGDYIAGNITIKNEETVWEFQPTQPWDTGSYRLVAKTTLEDLAGNSLGRPFEVMPSPIQAAALIPEFFGRQFELSAAGN